MALARKTVRATADARRYKPGAWDGPGVPRALARLGTCPMELSLLLGISMGEATALSLRSGRVRDADEALRVTYVAKYRFSLSLRDGGRVTVLRSGGEEQMHEIRDRLLSAPRRKARDCLRCGERFLSEHAGHRHCGDCRVDFARMEDGE